MLAASLPVEFCRVGFGGSTGGQTIRMPFDNGNADDRTPASTMQNQNNALSPLIGGGVGGIETAGGLGTGIGGFAGGVGGLGAGGGQVATLPGGARVSADVATNSLIVYAPASVQPLYEKLIRSLDQRRPQVHDRSRDRGGRYERQFFAGRGGLVRGPYGHQQAVQIHLIRPQRGRSDQRAC